MRLKYLDVLKSFAILAVVLYHSGFMTFGYLGVDLFLVINGYLITKSLNNKVLKSEERVVGTYLNFEISRVVRLLPVLLVAGIACMAIGFWTMLPDDYENLSESVVATNLFANNILAAITTKNYWDVMNEFKPLMHTWYVGVVMQFYIVYPILFFLAKLNKKNPQRTLLVLVSSLGAVSILVYFMTTDVAFRFYYLPSRFFEFAAGGMVALAWKPKEGGAALPGWLSFCCYTLVLAIMAVDYEFIPANIRLVTIVALSVVLVMSSNALENKVTGNSVLAKIGAASYSIFVWHQVLLAFYRYTISSHFTVWSYILFLIAVAALSWLTYRFIEQKTNGWLKENKSKTIFYAMIIVTFLGLNVFAGYIFKKGGVVRNVPELYINKNDKVDHKAYNDKIYKLDKPFETNKRHWLVVGNSFGRDFANVILESSVADSIELSYIFVDNFKDAKYADRYASADLVWLSCMITNEEIVSELDVLLQQNGLSRNQLVVVGTKNFGTSNGQFYVKRGTDGYFEQRTCMEEGYEERNDSMKLKYGGRYLDLIGLVIDENHTVPVFTPDHKFISQDCRHFSMGGAKWFAMLIDWDKYLHE